MEYEDIVEKDLKLHFKILEICNNYPFINENMNKIISKYPWQDICLIITIGFIFGIFEIGPKFFWICIFNLGISYILRIILQSKRPVEYDKRLWPLTDTNADSYGFPSIESYMSIIVFGQLMKKFPYIWFIIISIIIIFLVGFSRIYSKSRFTHQIIGSWVLGFIGLNVISRLVNVHYNIEKLRTFHHWWLVIIACCIVIIFVALDMENNDSRLMNINKKEFIRVLSDIMNGTSSNPSNNNDNNCYTIQNSDGSLHRIKKPLRDQINNSGIYPNSTINNNNNNIQNLKELKENNKLLKYSDRIKYDSFYYLQKNLMKRNVKSNIDSNNSLVDDDLADFRVTPRYNKV